ncbi:MAG: hypothetical protein ACREBU_01385 [Nitrososphaera sp.]
MSRWARALTEAEFDAPLDLARYVGQRAATYRFDLVDTKTGVRRPVHPLRGSPPTLAHDTSSTITRQLSNFTLGAAESSLINVVTGRIEPFMVQGGREFPLGRYMFNAESRLITSGGTTSNAPLYDEMFLVDQPISESFAHRGQINLGVAGAPGRIQFGLKRLLEGLPITFEIAFTPYLSDGGWGPGTNRGQIIEDSAIDGAYFSPWFDNNGVLKFIRVFDPTSAPLIFDYDTNNVVIAGSIRETDDLINAPNRFIVISNGAGAIENEIRGSYDIPSSAPHSIENRGFVIPHVETRQVGSPEQAKAVARNIGQRSTVFETVELSTPPDPRHDSYDVVQFRGSRWLELAWSLTLTEGSAMRHVLRRAYPET